MPGRDYAGIVVDGDPDWIGKEVWGASPGLGGDSHGPHAERVAVKTATLVEKPKELSMEEAATFGIPHLVSWSGLVDTGEVETGETVLVTGATGAVGQAATQIAHWQGAHVIGVDIVEGPTEADTYIRPTGQDIARPSARPRRTVKAWISPSTRWAVRCSSRHWAHCG